MLETIFAFVEKILNLAEVATQAKEIVSAVFDFILGLFA